MVEVEILEEDANSKKTSVDSPPTNNTTATTGDTSTYIYNGDDNKEVPKDVTHIKVDSSVTIIPQNAFKDLTNLKSIELPKGLIRIEDHAFENCKSLTSINIPSTVISIGNFAFCKCKKLQSISFLPTINEEDEDDKEGQQLERIGEYAFKSCKSITHIKLPTSITTIDKCAFYNCNIQHFHIPPLVTKFNISSLGNNNNLVSLEVHDNVTYIQDNVTLNNKTSEIKGMTSLISLRNVALPPSSSTSEEEEGEEDGEEVQECKLDPCRVGGKTLLTRCTSLIDFGFPEAEGDEAYITDALRQRFDNLPIHKICYHYCYNDTQSTLTQLQKEIIPSLWKRREINPTGKQQDCLGMTPLHILACSTKQQDSMEIYQLLIDKYPETLIMEDKWGDIPLLYAIWCNASKDVIDLLVKSYKTYHPEYEFDYVITLRLEVLMNGREVFEEEDDDIKGVESLGLGFGV